MVGTATVGLDFEAKLDLGQGESATRLMLHGTTRISATQIAITVRLNPGSEHLRVRVLPGKRSPTHTTRGTMNRAGIKADLHPGQRMTWRLPALRPRPR